ncbi:MFS transporter [Actinokineospora inagensis]|uniref:MFS transporter n=1 Tax=Actinokineospora inagensis TaxID=103730 RepID=UPI000687D732|nr:MFS transporter [Actinokineospora inagensis]
MDPERPTRVRVVAGFLVFVAVGMVSASLGAGLPFLRARYGLGPAGGGSVISAYNLGALAAVLGNAVLGRFVPRGVAAVGPLVAFGVGCAGMVLAPGWAVVLGAAVVGGAGFGGLVVHLNTVFARGFGARGVLMVNLLNAAFGVGAVIGPLLTSAVGGLGVRLPLALGVVFAVVAVPATRLTAPGEPTTHPTRSDLTAALPFAVIGFLYAGLETSVGAWESTHLTWTGTAAGDAARLTALFWTGLAVGRVVIPAALHRLRPSALVCGGLAGATAALATAMNPDLAVVGYALAGFALAPVFPTTLAWMAPHTPRAQLANSVVVMGCMLANAVQPAVVGVLADPDTPSRIPLTLTGFAALGLVAALLTARYSPASPVSPTELASR